MTGTMHIWHNNSLPSRSPGRRDMFCDLLIFLRIPLVHLLPLNVKCKVSIVIHNMFHGFVVASFLVDSCAQFTHILKNVYITHWGREMHICVGRITVSGSDNGLSPGRYQAIFWTNAGILVIRPLGTNLGEIVIEIGTFLFKKMHLKMSSGKWRMMVIYALWFVTL